MTWVRIDDGFARHPKVMEAGPFAIAMQVAALCYCNRELTDGFIPKAIAKTLINWNIEGVDGETWEIGIIHQGELFGNGETVDSLLVIKQMVAYGLWDEIPGGYSIHDYHDYQPSKEQVLLERQSSAARQQRHRARNGHSNNHSNAVTNGVSNGNVTGAPYPYLKEKEPTVLKRKNRGPVSYTDDFLEFWSLTHRVGSKQTASQYWEELEDGDRAEISRVINEWTNFFAQPDVYQQHVSTWISKRMWESSIPRIPNRNGRAPQSRVWNTEGTM